MGRGNLTDRMPRHKIRTHPERLDQPPQRHLHRKQPRLREHRPVQIPTRPLLRKHLTQRTRQQPLEPRTHLRQRLREHRERRSQLRTHPRPLRTLPREQHRNPAIHDTLRRDPTQPRNQFPGIPAPHHRTRRKRRPPRGQRPPHIHRIQTDGRLRKPLRLSGQRLGRPRRHHPRHDRQPLTRHHHRPRLGVLRRSLLKNHVRVRAGHAERRDADATRMVVRRPLLCRCEQSHRTGRPVHMLRRGVDVQRRRQHTLPQGHHHLDHACDTGRRLRVADVRLHRPQPQRPVLRPLLAIGRHQGLRLDRITQRGARAVRLHRVHVGGRQTCAVQGLADHPLLGGPVRRSQAVAGAVLVDRRSSHDGQHLVAVPPRVRQPLHQQQADALGPAGAVRGRGERLAPAVGRQPALPAELDEDAGARQHGDAAGQGHVALAVPQRLGRQVQGDQRRGTGGVDGHRGALKAECVGDAPGEDAGRDARHGEALGALRHMQCVDVAEVRAAHEDTGAVSFQRCGRDTGSFECLPGGFQQQPLLRVHRQRLTRADAEEVRVELGRVVEEAALIRVAGARVVRVGMEQLVQVPAPVGGEVAHRVCAVGDETPQVFRRAHPAGEPAGHADDRDGLLAPRLGELQTLAGFPQVSRHQLEVFAELRFVAGHSASSPGTVVVGLLGGRDGVRRLSRGRALC